MSTIPGTTHQDTLAARYALNSDEAYGAVIPPLYMSSNFSFQGFGEKREYDYTRSGNPTRDQLAGALSAAFAEQSLPCIVDVVVTRDPAKMLPAVDNRAVQAKKGDRVA